jgi:uncharacterized protein YlaI
MSWEIVAGKVESLPETYKLFECSECGNRVASPEKPEIICFQHKPVEQGGSP